MMAHTFCIPPTKAEKLSSAEYAMTLAEVGIVMGLSHERIRQIEKGALNKLRKYCMPELLKMQTMCNALRASRGSGEHTVIR